MGIALGLLLGVKDGDCVGVRVVGVGVGPMDGVAVGLIEGLKVVGLVLGVKEGDCVGVAVVGAAVGVLDGVAEGV